MLDPRYNPPYRLPKNPHDWIDPRRIEMQLNRQRTVEQTKNTINDPRSWEDPRRKQMRLNHQRTVEQNKNNPNDPMNWRNSRLVKMEKVRTSNFYKKSQNNSINQTRNKVRIGSKSQQFQKLDKTLNSINTNGKTKKKPLKISNKFYGFVEPFPNDPDEPQIIPLPRFYDKKLGEIIIHMLFKGKMVAGYNEWNNYIMYFQGEAIDLFTKESLGEIKIKVVIPHPFLDSPDSPGTAVENPNWDDLTEVEKDFYETFGSEVDDLENPKNPYPNLGAPVTMELDAIIVEEAEDEAHVSSWDATEIFNFYPIDFK